MSAIIAGPPKTRRSPALAAVRNRLGAHIVLIVASVMALGPVVLVVLNSFKTSAAVYSAPFTLPTGENFSVSGYLTVFSTGQFGVYYLNSIIVTVASVILVILLSSLAAFGLTEYRVRLSGPILAVFAVGIMLPIRLATTSILQEMVSLHLVNTLVALILVYVASSLPLGVVLMASYFRSAVPDELKEAARLDGANDLRVLSVVLPLVRPGIAAVASVTMLPVWNDLWFPLILAPSAETQTVTYGVQQFVGQYQSDWPTLLAALSMGAVPLIVLFAIFSRQFIAGLGQGIGR